MRSIHRFFVTDDLLSRQALSLTLPVPTGELAEYVRGQIAARYAGSAVGVVAVGALVLWIPRQDALSGPLLFLLAVTLLLLGLLFGRTVGGLLAGRRRPTGPRVARERAVTVADYLPAWVRRITWGSAVAGLSCLLAVAVCLVTGLFQPLPQHGPTLAVTLTAALLVSAVLLVACLRLTAREAAGPSRAREDVGLAWVDALRARRLADLNTVPAVVGLACALAALNLLVDGPILATGGAGTGAVYWTLTGTTGVVLTAVWALMFATSGQAVRTHRHFLRRLWGGHAPTPTATRGGAV